MPFSFLSLFIALLKTSTLLETKTYILIVKGLCLDKLLKHLDREALFPRISMVANLMSHYAHFQPFQLFESSSRLSIIVFGLVSNKN